MPAPGANQQARFWNSAKLNDNIMLQYPRKQLCTRIANLNNYNFGTTKYLIITLCYSFPSKEQNRVLSTMKKKHFLCFAPSPPVSIPTTLHLACVFRSLGLIIWIFTECTVEWQSKKTCLATLTWQFQNVFSTITASFLKKWIILYFTCLYYNNSLLLKK